MLTVGAPGSLIVPVAFTPPTLKAVVSPLSARASVRVGYVTVNVVTPAGTVIVPPASVTPLLKVGAFV